MKWREAMKSFVMFLLCTVSAFAQLPDAPSHKFLDRQNKIAFTVEAVSFAGDSITTNIGLNQGDREMNPIARPFVGGGVGKQAAYWGMSYAGSIGAAYLFHRTGHHKLERWSTRVVIGVEAFCIVNNTRNLR
jgi:hypothetical protein